MSRENPPFRWLQSVSLRVLLMSLVGLLMAAALVFAFDGLQRSAAVRKNAELLDERNELATTCLRAVKEFLVERDRSLLVLHGKKTADAPDRQRIEEQRRLVDSLHESLTTHAYGRFWSESLRRAWEGIKDLRREIDRDAMLPPARRDSSLPQRWFFSSDELISLHEAMLAGISTPTDNTDVLFERLSEQRLLALQLRNLVDQESVLLAEGASVRPLERQDVSTFSFLHGRIMQTWLRLEARVGGQNNPELMGTLEPIRAELFDRLRPWQDGFILGDNGRPAFAGEASTPLAVSLAVLDSAVALLDWVDGAMAAYIAQRLAEAGRQERLSLVSIVAILSLALLVIALLELRFTRPLNGLLRRINTLARAAHNEAATTIELSDDEFGTVEKAVERLEETEKELLQSALELDRRNTLLNTLLETIPVGVYMAEAESGKTIIANPKFGQLCGRSPQLDESGDAFLAHCGACKLPERTAYPSEELPVTRAMRGEEACADDILLIRPDGSERVLEVTGAPVRDADGKVWAVVVGALDITERHRVTAEMTNMAFHDALTQLPNRRLFYDRLQVAINRARREKSRMAVMVIDLDRFKPVNDNLGHEIGDLLLQDVARRMSGCLRDSDTLARIGGDEFAVVLPDIEDASTALAVGEKIRAALNEPFDLIGQYTVSIACCVGVAVYPDHGRSETLLIKNADDAMYLAKEGGRNQVGLSRRSAADSGASAAAGVERLHWRRVFESGNAVIDREHRALFDYANALLEARFATDGRVFGDVRRALDELTDAVAKHFVSEEKILADCAYPDLEAHRLKHQKLLGRALELRALALNDDLALDDLVSFAVLDVVSSHLLGEDRKYFSRLRESAGGARVAPDGG